MRPKRQSRLGLNLTGESNFIMKITGHKFDGPKTVIIPIPRDEGDVIFKARAVLDYEEFDAICPTPKPPTRKKPGETVGTPNFEDPTYQKKLDEFARNRSSYMIIKSLEATDGLNWDTIKLSEPETWSNFEKELKDSYFSEIEVAQIINGVFDANSLSDDKIKEARERFLASQRQQEEKVN